MESINMNSIKKSIDIISLNETFSQRLKRITLEEIQNRPRTFDVGKTPKVWEDLTDYLKMSAICSFMKIDKKEFCNYKVSNIEYDGRIHKIISMDYVLIKK